MKPLPILFAAILPLAGLSSAEQPARPYGAGTITRCADGRTAVTTRYGNGTITRFSDGRTAVTTRYGNGTITRFSDGRTAVTTRYGHNPSAATARPSAKPPRSGSITTSRAFTPGKSLRFPSLRK